jgi:hypothetical protein
MRAYVVILLLAGGLGLIIGTGCGLSYGIGAAMLLGGILELFHNFWRGIF